MRYCPNCKTNFGVYAIKFDTSNHPVEKHTEFNYCPVCGYEFDSEINLNVYDTTSHYSNCIVEILESSVTGKTSIGWYPTESTEKINLFDEELREQC